MPQSCCHFESYRPEGCIPLWIYFPPQANPLHTRGRARAHTHIHAHTHPRSLSLTGLLCLPPHPSFPSSSSSCSCGGNLDSIVSERLQEHDWEVAAGAGGQDVPGEATGHFWCRGRCDFSLCGFQSSASLLPHQMPGRVEWRCTFPLVWHLAVEFALDTLSTRGPYPPGKRGPPGGRWSREAVMSPGGRAQIRSLFNLLTLSCKPNSTFFLCLVSLPSFSTPFLVPLPQFLLLSGSFVGVIDKISKSIHVTFIVQVSINPLCPGCTLMS